MVVCMCDVKVAVKRLFTASSSRLTLESVCRGRAGATGAAAAVFAGCQIIKLELKEISSQDCSYAYRNIENVQFITNVLAYMMLLLYIQRYKLGHIIVMHYYNGI